MPLAASLSSSFVPMARPLKRMGRGVIDSVDFTDAVEVAILLDGWTRAGECAGCVKKEQQRKRLRQHGCVEGFEHEERR